MPSASGDVLAPFMELEARYANAADATARFATTDTASRRYSPPPVAPPPYTPGGAGGGDGGSSAPLRLVGSAKRKPERPRAPQRHRAGEL